MFATLLGPLPNPAVPSDRRSSAWILRAAVAGQESAGLELVTDGGLQWSDPDEPLLGLSGLARGEDGQLVTTGTPTWRRPLTVDAWASARAVASIPVKQALPGPYSLARRLAPDGVDRDRLGDALALALRAEIAALAEAGCPFVEIHEPAAVEIGEDPAERARFVAAQGALVDGLDGIHLSLAITGGNADVAGAATIFAAPYASYAFDLIDGPDNWRLIALAPGDRGIICGAISVRAGSDDGPELLVWAAHYAASTGGRGLVRVGLAPAGSLGGLPWELAYAKMRRLGEAARAAVMPPDELRRVLDPRTFDPRKSSRAAARPAIDSDDPTASPAATSTEDGS